MNGFIDTLIQPSLFSDTLATVIGGIVLYFFLQSQINKIIEDKKKVNLLKNLAGDFSYNFVKAEKISQNSREYLEKNRFTLTRYQTKALITFYYQKPFPEKDKFPYIKLLSFIDRFESDNSLRNSILRGGTEDVISENKKQFLNNVERYKKDIPEFLNEIEGFYKRYKIILREYS